MVLKSSAEIQYCLSMIPNVNELLFSFFYFKILILYRSGSLQSLNLFMNISKLSSVASGWNVKTRVVGESNNKNNLKNRERRTEVGSNTDIFIVQTRQKCVLLLS